MSNALVLIVTVLMQLLRLVQSRQDCPDGVCDEPLTAAESLRAELKTPSLTFGVWDFMKLVRCFPMDRVIAVVKRIGSLLKGCDRCPDGDCSFLDVIGCLDLTELVAIVREVISIIEDATICDGDDGEITLGQAVGSR